MIDVNLRVAGGPFCGQTIPIRSRKLLIGRAEDCDLRPDSCFVSGHHCVLLLDDYTLRIRDLGSKNGTIINGRRIGTSTTILMHNDLVSIGDMNILIDFSPAKAETGSADAADRPPVSPAMLTGTGAFDGDTVESEISGASFPTAVSPPAPIDPNADSPSNAKTP